MSMSVDTSQLETVMKFASFVEAITDPKQLKDTLKNVQVVTADYKEKLGLITTKQEADRYLEQVRVKLEEANAYLAKEKAHNDSIAFALQNALTAKNSEVARTLGVLSGRQSEADANIKETERMKREANALLNSAFEKNKLAETKAQDLAKLETRLNEKQAKLNQILG
jgi:chromosome segregation ATPase